MPTTRFLLHGAVLGAGGGIVVTGVLATWGYVTTSAINAVAAAFMVAIGVGAGAAIGTVTAGLASVVHTQLAHKVSPRACTWSTAAAAGVGAGGCWFLGSRRNELVQPASMMISIGLVAVAVTALALRSNNHDRSRSGGSLPMIGGVVVLAGLVGLGTAAAGIAGAGPLASTLGNVETSVRPATFATSSDERVLHLGVVWQERDYCDGQFTVEPSENPTEVRLSEVVSRADRNYWSETCVGWGAADGIAWVDVPLTAPLGDRVVVDSYGVEVPFDSQ